MQSWKPCDIGELGPVSTDVGCRADLLTLCMPDLDKVAAMGVPFLIADVGGVSELLDLGAV